MSSGEKVMGLVSEGAIANNVEADPELLWPVPEHWTLEDAATVPLPYTLAYYCLGIRCRLFNGMSVFIVGGSGALGQALITVCLAADCTVYTSVKKNITHTGTSGTSFQDMIRINTKDKRCNIVINCLSGKIREAAMKCVGYDSNFLDLSDFDMKNNEDFGMKYLILSTHYKAKLQAMLSEGIAKGYVRPLTRVVYSPVNVTKAFRLLSSYNHKGKVLLKMNNLDYLNQQLKYSKKKPSIYRSWNKLNVTIKISSDNLQTEKGCGNLMEEAKKLGPIQGIFIVQDLTDAASLESENVAEKFNNMASIVAKLDLTSRSASNELEQFVVISYSGNNVTDELMVSVTNAICSARKEISLPALSFHIGLLNELDETNPEKTRSSLAANFNALETCLKLNYTNVKSYNPNKRTSDFLHTVSTFTGTNHND
ncbi:Uncharacterized protein OBRU01_05234 [Operophtera brumata]|uniref:Enoyl reductase (ER) domain-containing protein n=1 Tax=Operophtera brumata TaxID=104452 RepID=A0A0L7LNK7_OPEBR|nr:Uncharacterized protein OBRU01_05234 [Operophtera brumata]